MNLKWLKLKSLTKLRSNMREIKFRIWNKQTKKFVNNAYSLHCFSNWSVDAFTGEIYDYVGSFNGGEEPVEPVYTNTRRSSITRK